MVDVLSDAYWVGEWATDVNINFSKLDQFEADFCIEKSLKSDWGSDLLGVSEIEERMEDKDKLLVKFIIHSINFCFWREDDLNWEVKYRGNKFGGSFGAVLAIYRGLENSNDLLNPSYLANMELANLKNVLRGENGIEIPLIEQRLRNINQLGRVLSDDYDGNCWNLLKEAKGDMLKLVKLIYTKLPSFADKSEYKGREIWFLKRAQVLASDLGILVKKLGYGQLINKHRLTAFADYRIPQLLRHVGILEYSDDLANKIDNLVLLPARGDFETEIRAATVTVVNEIYKRMVKRKNDVIPTDVNNSVWLLSKKVKMIKPHHRVKTIFY